jgi:hypothetical protein
MNRPPAQGTLANPAMQQCPYLFFKNVFKNVPDATLTRWTMLQA